MNPMTASPSPAPPPTSPATAASATKPRRSFVGRAVRVLLMLAGLFLLAVGGLLAVASQQPDDFKISRSLQIKATPAEAFNSVNDLKKFEEWNPFARMDPTAKQVYSGAESGVGAVCEWDSQGDAGSGKMTIVESVPAERVKMDLEFFRPFAARNEATFTFAPAGEAVEVTWAMSGQANLLQKSMGLVFDCDAMVGGEFEKGLANLKALLETPAAR